jgi:hypothetical protein
MQHSFEATHSAKECRDIIESYAAMGQDNHMTELKMREACSLDKCLTLAAPDAGTHATEWPGVVVALSLKGVYILSFAALRSSSASVTR